MRVLPELDLLLLLPLTAVLAGGCGPGERAIVDEARLIIAAADKGSDGKPEISAAAKRLDPARVDGRRLSAWADASVEAVRDAAAGAAFYFPEDERFAALQERALEEKLRRGPPVSGDLDDIFRAYMASRSFDKAKALRARFPGEKFPSMPDEFVDAASPQPGPAAWSVGRDWRKVEKTAVLLERFDIVMATFPGCSASEAALEDLSADPRTAKLLRERTLLLTDRFDAEGVFEVKRKFRPAAFLIVDKRSSYPALAFNASPRFYFLKDGKVVSDIVGWGRDAKKNRAEWLAAFTQALR